MFFKKEVIFKAAIPIGGFVLASNHVGWLDIVFLGTAMRLRSVHFMAKQELFKSAFTRWLLKTLNAFPVNRAKPGPSSLKIPLSLLRKEEIVGIFPSGTRSQESISLKKGAVTMAQIVDVPVVPAFYKGPSTISWKYLFKREKIRILIGNPLVETDQTKSSDEKRDSLLSKLQLSLFDLEKEL